MDKTEMKKKKKKKIFCISFWEMRINVCTCSTWDMFHLCLISATGSVATEHPHPINAIFTGSSCSRTSSKNASRDFPRLHCIEMVYKLSHLSKNAYAICTSHKERALFIEILNHSAESIPFTVELMVPGIGRNASAYYSAYIASRSRPAFLHAIANQTQ